MGSVQKRNFIKAFFLTFFTVSYARAKSLTFLGGKPASDLQTPLNPPSPVNSDFYANILREIEKNKNTNQGTNMFIREDDEFLVAGMCPENCYKGKGYDCWGPPDCKGK